LAVGFRHRRRGFRVPQGVCVLTPMLASLN
jgi:hypothetical protein